MNLRENPQILNLRNKALVADNRIHFIQFKEKGVYYTVLGTLQNSLEGHEQSLDICREVNTAGRDTLPTLSPRPLEWNPHCSLHIPLVTCDAKD